MEHKTLFGMGNGNYYTWEEYLDNHKPETSSGTIVLNDGETGGTVTFSGPNEKGEYHSLYKQENKYDPVTKPLNNSVETPSHYLVGKLEVIDILKDKMTKEQYKGFLLGNVLKYSMRFEHKNGKEDLLKAQKYLNWLIESYED